MRQYHFWDMDHTLIDNDCDVSWKQFLVARGEAPGEDAALADRYFEDYLNDRLDSEAFLIWQLAEFAGRSPEQMQPLLRAHFQRMVEPVIYPAARRRIAELKAAGAFLCMLTATNRPVATPLAEHLAFDDIVATELEIVDGLYTGRLRGAHACGPGKLRALQAYATEQDLDLARVWYYGDSRSDIPTLEAVGHPVACNPGEPLRALAQARGWEIRDFRQED